MVQILPNVESVNRLVGALLVEINGEMIAAERRYFATASVTALLDDPDRLPPLPAAPAPDNRDARFYTTPRD